MMKRLAPLFLLLATLSAFAGSANVTYKLSDFGQTALTNATITLTPLSAYGTSGTNILLPPPITKQCNTNGVAVFSNLVNGFSYRAQARTFNGSVLYAFTNSFPTNATGEISAADYLTVLTNMVNDGTSAYSRSQSDARYPTFAAVTNIAQSVGGSGSTNVNWSSITNAPNVVTNYQETPVFTSAIKITNSAGTVVTFGLSSSQILMSVLGDGGLGAFALSTNGRVLFNGNLVYTNGVHYGDGAGLTNVSADFLTPALAGSLATIFYANSNPSNYVTASITNGLGLSAAQAATLNAAVTNRYGATNILQWRDPYHLYATGAGVAGANGKYTWAGFGVTTNGYSDTWDKVQIQNYSPAWTNSAGFMVWRSYGQDFYSDFVLTKTNVDWSASHTNVYYALGGKTYPYFVEYSGWVSFFNIETNWDNELNAMFYDDLPNFQTANYPTLKFGTNSATNIAIYSSSFPTNSKTIYIDSVNGDDSKGNLSGYPFKTIQAATAIEKLNGGGFTWHIASGSYDITGYTWMPTNATVFADKNSIIWMQDKTISTGLIPTGDFECHGGYFYQPIGYGFNGPFCLFSPYTTSLWFINNKMVTDMGCVQGLIGSRPTTTMIWDGCDYSSGSYAIELQAAINNRIDAHIYNTIIREYSWNPSLAGIGLIHVFLQHADCYMSGGSLILSNSFTASDYPSDAVGIKFNPAATNTLYLSGVLMDFNKGTNTNYKYIDASNISGKQTAYLFGTSYPTNRLVGIFTNSPP